MRGPLATTTCQVSVCVCMFPYLLKKKKKKLTASNRKVNYGLALN